MPSPNGYFDFETPFFDTSRNSFRFTITFDANNPPWIPPANPDFGDYQWTVEYSTTAVGPWTLAPLASNLADPCAAPGPNPKFINGIVEEFFHINDVANIVHDQDYFVRVTLTDFEDTQVDQFVSPVHHTIDYPTIQCVGNGLPTKTSLRGLYATNNDGEFNILSPCSNDSVIWEISTVSGGPYIPEPVEDVTGFAPSHVFTGLTPGTQYFLRGRFTEQVDTNGEFLVGPECTFTTLGDPSTSCLPATNILPGGGTINGETLDNAAPGDVARLRWGTTPGGPYPNVGPNVPAATPTQLSDPISGLNPTTTYYYVVEFVRGVDILDTSSECEFTTTAFGASTDCNPATNILPTSGTINGEVQGDGEPGDTAHLEWGTVQGGPYPNVTPDQPASDPTDLSEDLTGLTEDTPYYYRVVWTRGVDILDQSEECTFTTTHWCFKGVCS